MKTKNQGTVHCSHWLHCLLSTAYIVHIAYTDKHDDYWPSIIDHRPSTIDITSATTYALSWSTPQPPCWSIIHRPYWSILPPQDTSTARYATLSTLPPPPSSTLVIYPSFFPSTPHPPTTHSSQDTLIARYATLSTLPNWSSSVSRLLSLHFACLRYAMYSNLLLSHNLVIYVVTHFIDLSISHILYWSPPITAFRMFKVCNV